MVPEVDGGSVCGAVVLWEIPLWAIRQLAEAEFQTKSWAAVGCWQGNRKWSVGVVLGGRDLARGRAGGGRWGVGGWEWGECQ